MAQVRIAPQTAAAAGLALIALVCHLGLVLTGAYTFEITNEAITAPAGAATMAPLSAAEVLDPVREAGANERPFDPFSLQPVTVTRSLGGFPPPPPPPLAGPDPLPLPRPR